MSDAVMNHIGYLLHQPEIEKMRKVHKESYRIDDPTAEVVMVLDGTDSERYPAVKRLREDGYVLVDANAFGIDGEVTGEFWVFSKKSIKPREV